MLRNLEVGSLVLRLGLGLGSPRCYKAWRDGGLVLAYTTLVHLEDIPRWRRHALPRALPTDHLDEPRGESALLMERRGGYLRPLSVARMPSARPEQVRALDLLHLSVAPTNTLTPSYQRTP